MHRKNNVGHKHKGHEEFKIIIKTCSLNMKLSLSKTTSIYIPHHPVWLKILSYMYIALCHIYLTLISLSPKYRCDGKIHLTVSLSQDIVEYQQFSFIFWSRLDESTKKVNQIVPY